MVEPKEYARYVRLFADPPEHYTVFQTKLMDLWLNHPTEAELSSTDLARIQAPTLVVAGDHDMILLEHTTSIYTSIPTAELLILPGSEHNTIGTQGKWLNPMIDHFLSKEIAKK